LGAALGGNSDFFNPAAGIGIRTCRTRHARASAQNCRNGASQLLIVLQVILQDLRGAQVRGQQFRTSGTARISEDIAIPSRRS
jgi:hypothetical protein